MTNCVKERPILMSAPMVRAILEGRKTVTRRAMNPQPYYDPEASEHHHTFGGKSGAWIWQPRKDNFWFYWDGWNGFDPRIHRNCPYGQSGDKLWVRETWAAIGSAAALKISDLNTAYGDNIVYRANCDRPLYYDWKPSIFMPRWASRLSLEIVNVSIERLWQMTVNKMLAEGVAELPDDAGKHPLYPFIELWNSINGSRAGCDWQSNPWVWVIEFKKFQLR